MSAKLPKEREAAIDAAVAAEVGKFFAENPGMRLLETDTVTTIFVAGFKAGVEAFYAAMGGKWSA